MKHIMLVCALLVIFSHGQAQHGEALPIDPITNKVSYSGVVEAPGISRKVLFENAKKWIKTKNTDVNPYVINYENATDGEVVGKGSFSLPGDRRKYTVQFTIKVAVKDNKFKYALTDLIVQFRTQAGSSGGGYGGWGGSSYREAETLEYSIETFYPARLHGRKPVIKSYEEINKNSFSIIDREIQSIVSSLRQITAIKDDW